MEHLEPYLRYPEERMSDSTRWVVMETIGTQAWANLRPGIIAGLTNGVTDLTLDIAPMMSVPDVTLQQSHMEESLEVLGERICPSASIYRC